MNKNAKLKLFATVVMKYNLWDKIPGLFRMIVAVLRRKYKPSLKIISIGILAIAYVISPFDIIPDPLIALFGIGILDDLAIMVFGLNKIFDEVKIFLNWELNQKNIPVNN